MILDELENVIRDVERSHPDSAVKARKCLPYIQCFSCLDTERIIGDRAVLTAFGYDPYMIRSCACTGRVKDISTTTHLNHTHNGRPIIYNGSYGTSSVSTKRDLVRVLARIYEQDYQAREEEIERNLQQAEEDKRLRMKAEEAARLRAEEHRLAVEAANKKRAEEEAARIKEEKRLKKEEEERLAAEQKRQEEEARRKRTEELKPYETKTEDELFTHASWKDVKNREDNQVVRETHIKVDIEALIKEVSNAIQAYSGNLLALTDLVRDLDMKFRDFKSHENKENTHIQVKEDKNGHPFFMKFTYRFVEDTVEEHCCFMDFSKKVKKIDSHLIVMRPKDDNLEAIEICRRLMNKEAELIIKGLL